MGSSHSKAADNSTINWNKINTDNISSTIPNYNNLSQEAQTLIANLDLNSLSESSSVNITELFDNIHSKLNINDRKHFTNMLNDINNISDTLDNDLSATSPFMSKDDYNKYLNSTTSENIQTKQTNLNNMKGGNHDDDSSTSSTSSLSSSSSDETSSSHNKSKPKPKENKKMKHNKNKQNKHKGGSSEDDSYISSSAHTGGDSSENNSANIISPATEDINSVSSD
jgi:hypothetical protein